MSYRLEDTIAAISTPQGTGGIGVIRLSGANAVAITEKLFSPTDKKPLSGMLSHTLTHGWINDSGTPVDEVMVSLMLKPRSYTGEDIVEISAHGGAVMLKRMLRLFLDNGARLAGPGEFTFRAFVNGKIDLAKAEAVADVIRSKTDLALKAAVSHLKGSLSVKLHEFKKEIILLLCTFEAAIEHSEEGVEPVPKDNAIETIQGLISEISQIVSSSEKIKFLRDGLNTVIIGKPNAGKSSLLNSLLEIDRAIVTDIPGTTRDVLQETIDIKGFPLVLMDTAGIREHTQDMDMAEKMGQSRTLEAIKSAQIIIWVLDASNKDLEPDLHISEILKNIAREKVIIPVWNKIDLPIKADVSLLQKLIPHEMLAAGVPAEGLKISARMGFGISLLEDALVSAFSFSPDILSGAVSANTRHIDALTRCRKELNEAVVSIEKGFTEEIQATHVRDALNCIGEITGETVNEEILENIFKTFCVGK